MNKDRLDSFIRAINALTSPQGIPGTPTINDLSAVRGARSSRTDAIYNLHTHVAAFAARYAQPVANKAALHAAAKQVEGYILVLESLSALSNTEAMTIIDELHALID